MNTRKKTWVPPHCPNPKCLYHFGLNPAWDYKKAGYFQRQVYPFRVQRFTCQHCGRSFSSQTFSTTYWQKLPELDIQIFMKAVSCSANRQIARQMKVSPSTIDRHAARVGRHCLLLHHKMMQEAEPPTEVVVDGFESFEWSQYFPFHHHLAVEKGTDFFIYFTDSPLRRKGRMTEAQKKRRAELEEQLGRPDPKAIEMDMAELLQETLKNVLSATVYSDLHRAYPRAIERVNCLIRHKLTDGRKNRNQWNELWEVNLLDLLIRHCSSNHKRETIAWSKRRHSSALKLGILLVWRNYMKGRREKQRGSPTPAMERGMLDRRLEVEDIFGERIFRSHIDLPPRWADYYDGKVETSALKVNRRHELKYAY